MLSSHSQQSDDDNATTARVLTREYVDSIKLTDEAALRANGLDAKKLAKKVVDIFLTQLLRSGVLHCDPHPGNMCVDKQGRLVFYDFGMVDTLKPEVQQGMRNAAFALFGGRPDGAAEGGRLRPGDARAAALGAGGADNGGAEGVRRGEFQASSHVRAVPADYYISPRMPNISSSPDAALRGRTPARRRR